MAYARNVRRKPNNMKTFIKVIFILSLIGIFSTLFFLPINEQKPEKHEIKVVTTIFSAYDIARSISKDTDVQNKMLIQPGSDLHNYEPSPRDIVDIKDSDIFIYNGGESEEWVQKIISEIDTTNTIIIRMMDLVELKVENKDGILEQEAEKAEGTEEQEEYDEHIWTSPKNAIKIAESIAQAFKNSNPDSTATYQRNLVNLTKEINKLDEGFRELANKKTGTLIVADRFPFKYFVDEYGFNYVAAFPGCSDQTEASAKTIAELSKLIMQNQEKVIFHLELTNTKIAQTLADSTGARQLTWHSLHNVSLEDFNAGYSYVDIMTKNLSNLSEALHDRIAN